MMKNGEKRYIPGTNPEWGRELPEGYSNSLVDAAGNAWDNGYNFDERDDDDEETQRELGAAVGKALTQEQSAEAGPEAEQGAPETE